MPPHVTKDEEITASTPTSTLLHEFPRLEEETSRHTSYERPPSWRRYVVRAAVFRIGKKFSGNPLSPWVPTLEILLLKQSETPTRSPPWSPHYWDLPGDALRLPVPKDPGRRSSQEGVEVDGKKLHDYKAPLRSEGPPDNNTVGDGVKRALKEQTGLDDAKVIGPISREPTGPKGEHLCLNFIVIVNDKQTVSETSLHHMKHDWKSLSEVEVDGDPSRGFWIAAVNSREKYHTYEPQETQHTFPRPSWRHNLATPELRKTLVELFECVDLLEGQTAKVKVVKGTTKTESVRLPTKVK